LFSHLPCTHPGHSVQSTSLISAQVDAGNLIKPGLSLERSIKYFKKLVTIKIIFFKNIYDQIRKKYVTGTYSTEEIVTGQIPPKKKDFFQPQKLIESLQVKWLRQWTDK
jgi:hypothetical protein